MKVCYIQLIWFMQVQQNSDSNWEWHQERDKLEYNLLWTNPTEKEPPSATIRSSASQGIPKIVWNPKVQQNAYKSPPLDTLSSAR
jgi:hypothetical protein